VIALTWPLKEKLQQALRKEIGAAVYAPGSRTGFVLAYPNTYNVGMSNLGFHIIYQQINLRGDTACERVFLPDSKTMQEYVRTNTPLMTLETQRPIYEFPIIGFAITFELDYFNILSMLAQGKVPLRAAERGEGDPIILIGGPCATFNPEPLADFIDACIVGEGEEVIHELLDVYYEAKEEGLTREETLLKFAGIDGVYVPRFYRPVYAEAGEFLALERQKDIPERIRRRWIRNLDEYPAQTVITTDDTEFKDMFLLEVARGCGRHCRFCMAGYCFRRPRVRSLDKLKSAIVEAKKYRSKVGLVGAAVSDYPEIDELCQAVMDLDMGMSVASLRADTLSPHLVDALVHSGHRTITLAPEAASERMRRVINKGISEEHLYEAVTMAVKAGIPHVRLYIMVGLPFEEQEDIEAIVLLAKSVKKHMENLGSGGRLTLSVNPFIPKPFTPFQWLPMAFMKEVEEKLKVIQTGLRSDRNIEVLIEPPKESYIQGVLSRGDRKLSAVLLTAHQQGGIRGWKQALKEHAVDPDYYLYRIRSLDEQMPWQHLDMGLNEGYLQAELAKASAELPTAACMPGCRRCGVCV
jgi:radical SAM family uncharacterized protein